jgi:hypothetical protein
MEDAAETVAMGGVWSSWNASAFEAALVVPNVSVTLAVKL